MACIGIIGGADGPIAIVCGDSSKEKLHAAVSYTHLADQAQRAEPHGLAAQLALCTAL